MRIDKENEQKEKFNRGEEEKIKTKLFDAALEEVLVQGWNKSAVAAAATKLGYPRVTAGLIGSMERLVCTYEPVKTCNNVDKQYCHKVEKVVLEEVCDMKFDTRYLHLRA